MGFYLSIMCGDDKINLRLIFCFCEQFGEESVFQTFNNIKIRGRSFPVNISMVQ